nr:hypothetical protein [Rhodococcus wratislaviensis]
MSDYLAAADHEWHMTAEITCRVDPANRAKIRAAVQLLSASGYVQTVRQACTCGPATTVHYHHWHRLVCAYDPNDGGPTT